jgi:hypothetical protein
VAPSDGETWCFVCAWQYDGSLFNLCFFAAGHASYDIMVKYVPPCSLGH